jgi:hypothetical protein
VRHAFAHRGNKSQAAVGFHAVRFKYALQFAQDTGFFAFELLIETITDIESMADGMCSNEMPCVSSTSSTRRPKPRCWFIIDFSM